MTDLDIHFVVDAVRSVVGASPAQLHEPEFAGNERRYLNECIDSTFVSSVGPFVDRFERMLEEITGARHAVACVNGTAALEMSLLLAGTRPGDEVIMPSLTFVAAANSVSHLHAVPHFVDCDEATLGLSVAALEARLLAVCERRNGETVNRFTERRIAAISPMHTFGHPVDIEGLLRISGEWQIPLVEDAAEGLGSFYNDRHVGNFGLVSALSFNGNKIITTGGGGAIVTNDSAIAARAKHLTTTAKVPHRWAFTHDAVGYNYRLPNLNAALGCAQLEQLEGFLREKRQLAAKYLDAFSSANGLSIFHEREGRRSNYWLNTLLLDEDKAGRRDDVLSALNDAGYMSRPLWTPMHCLQMYADCPRGDLSITESLDRRIINLPSSARLGRQRPA